MSDKDSFMDVKGRIPPDDYRVFSAIGTADDMSINEMVCALVHERCESERRRHRLIASLLQVTGSDGQVSEITGHSRK